MLSEKLDRVETRLDKRIDCLEHKLDIVAAETSDNTIAIKELAVETRNNAMEIRGLAADLAAHRQDTEAHPTIYKVKEGI